MFSFEKPGIPTVMLQLKPLSSWIACQLSRSFLFGSLVYSPFMLAETYFDPHALEVRPGGQAITDLSAFNRGEQVPGRYRVDVYLNNTFLETRDVDFISVNQRLAPQLTAQYWRALGVKLGDFPALAALPDDEMVTTPQTYIPDASATFAFNQQRLNLSIPQASLDFRARDYVDPASWDQGMPALLLNYALNTNNNWQRTGDGSNSNLFLRLDSGLNVGPWRLRNNSVYTHNTGKRTVIDVDGRERTERQTGSEWKSINTYLQRDIHALSSQLTLGETSTPGDLFDSVQFRGVQLASDDNMLPDSLRGFAPVVRGIAASNAQVIIQQNGNVIYQTSVAPGAFEIKDLYPSASSGTLDVTIREADGSETSFVQPFSSVPGMQREGRWRYSLTGGKFRSYADDARDPTFLQGTLQYGLTNATTIYGGGITAADYQSGLLGVGQGLGTFGSLSLDVTHAKTHFSTLGEKSGQSYRAQYAKDILQSGTSFVLAGYRYSTQGFYDFQEANEMLSHTDNDDWNSWRRTHNKRSKMQAQINQNMGDFGSLSLTGYQQDYWNSDGAERTLMLGYNVSQAGITYGLNLSDTRYPRSDANRRLSFNVQVPLDKWLAGSRVSYGLTTDNRNRTRHDVGFSGSALEDNRLSYSVRESYTNQGEGNGGSASLDYSGTYGRVNGGYSYSQHNQQVNAGLSGGIVAHPYGVTFSQPLGDTMALVRAPGANDARVYNQRGVTTDWRGYAVVPYVSAYRKNNVKLATETLGDDVDLDQAATTVIPTRGALVLANFKTNVGARMLATLTYQGKPVPFGATTSLIVDGKPTSSSFVGDGGDVYLSGVPAKSQLLVSWGKGRDQQCRADLQLPEQKADTRFTTQALTCR
jgi:outer membrane usher protein